MEMNLIIVAPGSNILSALPNNSTGSLSGTSMAAPHAAGVAALILSVNHNLTRQGVTDVIESTAQKLSSYTYFDYNRKTQWHMEYRNRIWLIRCRCCRFDGTINVYL